MASIKYLFLSCLCAALLTACAKQINPEQNNPQKPATNKSLQLQMLNMEPQFLYLAAQNALKDGNPELASQFLDTLIKKDPNAVEPHLQLTKLLLQLGKLDEATGHIDLLLHKQLKDEDFEKLSLTQIRLKIAKNELDSALELSRTFLAKQPVNTHARDLQARILSNQDRIPEALTAIEEAIQIKEKPAFRLLQAQLFLKQGDTGSAKISLQRLIHLDPENDAAALMLSGIALKEKDSAAAEKILRTFINANPGDLRARDALGKILIQQDRAAEAILIYRELDTRSGGNPEIRRMLGILYFKQKELEKAAQIFRELNKNHPSDQNRYYLGSALEALEQPQQAKAVYESISSNSHVKLDAQVRIAAIEFSADNLTAAESRLKQILAESAEHMEAQLMLSSIRLTQKRYKQLIDETSELLTQEKIHPQLLFNRAVAFDHLKQYKQVDNMLSRVLDQYPNHSEALNFLGYTYAIQGIELDKAERLILKALTQKPDDGYYLDSLAWAYYRNGKIEKALKTQERALKQISDDPVMFEHYGDILWDLNKADQARKAWQQAVDMKPENSEAIKKKIKSGPDSQP